jgi:hypothetical protein
MPSLINMDNLSQQSSVPNVSKTQEPAMLILGWYLGLGALIQSTVNSIWLAKKLGRTSYIWWGNSCLYTDQSVGGNTYPKLFQEPQEHQQFNFTHQPLIYPIAWNATQASDGIETLDAMAPTLVSDRNLEIAAHEYNLLATSNLCIVYQYVSRKLALSMARASGVDVSMEQFLGECSEIFAHYFQPRADILASADAIWQKCFQEKQSVIGMHVRGTDKVFEVAIPSPHHFLHATKKLTRQSQGSAFYIATDSEHCLQYLQQRLANSGTIGAQPMKRSNNQSGVHYKSGGAFENGVEMLIDIELLCRCKTVLAFPGSQIFWWLTRKREGEQMTFELLSVQASSIAWLYSGLAIFRTYGWSGLVEFLRIRKAAVLSFLKSKFSGRN